MKTWLAVCGVVAPLVIVLPAAAISPAEVSKIAKGVTVSITTPQGQGSGAIIDRDGNTYTVLTAAHVVKKNDRQYTIELSDGSKHAIASKQLAPTGNLDLAVIKFTSNRNYPIAKIGNSSSATEGSTAYVAGFPQTTIAITRSIYTFSDGKITANSSKPFDDGYSLVYSCNTLPGMSGGPVLNERGELIAIHGRGDRQENKQSEVNSGVWVKTGFNLGIPINSFLQVATKMGASIGGAAPTVIASPPRPTAADDFFVTATNKFREGDYTGAIAGFDRAIAAKPRYAAAYIGRAEANIYLDRDSEVIRDANLALQIDPKSDRAYALRGAGKTGRGDVKGAFADYDRAIAINPRNARTHLYRGFAQVQYVDPKIALKSIERALALDPSLGDAYSVRGVANYLTGNRQASEADFQRAIQISPNSFLAYAYRGLVRTLAGDKRAGFADLDKAIGLSPKNAIVYDIRAQAHAGLEDHNRAVADFNRALAIDANNDGIYARRALAYLGQNKSQLALRDIEKSLSLNDINEAAYQARSLYHFKNQNFRQSLADINRALNINGSSPESYFLRGITYVGMNNRNDARQSLQQAAKIYKERNNTKFYQSVMQVLKLLSST
jgi:tetratricopeptide (TPR) repeat protein